MKACSRKLKVKEKEISVKRVSSKINKYTVISDKVLIKSFRKRLICLLMKIVKL